MSKRVISLPNLVDRQCECCGAHGVRMSYQRQTFKYGEDQDAVDLYVQVPVWTCDSCGDQYTDERAEDIRHEAVCAHLGRLSPREIKELRESCGLNQQQWADLTGFGIASVKRWESGSLIQGLAQDRYMRLLGDRRNLMALKAMTAPLSAEMTQDRMFRSRLPNEAYQRASLFVLRRAVAVN